MMTGDNSEVISLIKGEHVGHNPSNVGWAVDIFNKLRSIKRCLDLSGVAVYWVPRSANTYADFLCAHILELDEQQLIWQHVPRETIRSWALDIAGWWISFDGASKAAASAARAAVSLKVGGQWFRVTSRAFQAGGRSNVEAEIQGARLGIEIVRTTMQILDE